jgi:tripartite ATP-independent transporter DctP family solute receptor
MAMVLSWAPTAMAQTPELVKLATINPANHMTHPAVEKFAQLVEQRSGGRVKVELFLNGVLGQERAQTEGVMLGTIDAALSFPTSLSTLDPIVDVINLPYIWRDEGHAHKVLWGPVGERISRSVLGKTRIRILGWPDQGFRQVITVGKPVNKLGDLMGLKIRVPESPNFVELFRRLGANPTPVPWGEVYTALQTKLVDGAEVDYRSILAKKLQEPTNYMAITNHIFLPGVLIMSDRAFQRLSKDLQEVVVKAAKDAVEYQSKLTERMQEEAFNDIAKKLKVTQPDLKPFRDRLVGYQDEWAKSHGLTDLLEAIRATK